ncbi:MAG: DNA primase [Cyclobacteriaceae bacterium]|nr:DNA primase [Cyclobacteriaceae bacterium]
MILQETIEEVKDRLDIVDVISDFITLKKSGQNYKALSPFTNEKTPSFFVVPSKGIFKDFSSGKGGDSFTFLMEHEGMSYAEAIRFLAKKYGVEVKETEATDQEAGKQGEREGLYILMDFAKKYFHSNLLHDEEGQSIGLSYFRERGFNDKSIEKFELGYALNGWENFGKEALAKGYSQDLLGKTGLVVKKEDGSSYDRFRGRVVFPVHNISGKVIAFGARMLGKEKNQPKYINSPETEIYHKGKVLYGLFQAKNAIRQNDNCYLVEGYTDVVSLHQAGVCNVVASSGTALTEEQIKLVRRFSENVTVLFDGDAAGIKAALRGIDLILKGGLNVRVVLFPDGEDPDSYSRKLGTSDFQNFLKEQAKDIISFKVDLLKSEFANDPIKRAESLREILGTLAAIPNEVNRRTYYRSISLSWQIDEQTVIHEINKIRWKNEEQQFREQRRNETEAEIEKEELGQKYLDLEDLPLSTDNMVQFQEKETIRLLLNYADEAVKGQKLSDFLFHELEDVAFVNPIFGNIFESIKEGWGKGEVRDSHYFINNGSEEVKQVVTGLIAQRYDISQHWGDKYHIYIPKEGDILNEMAYTNVLRLKLRIVQKMLEENKGKIKEAEEKGDEAGVDGFLNTQIGLDNAKKELSQMLGIVIAR